MARVRKNLGNFVTILILDFYLFFHTLFVHRCLLIFHLVDILEWMLIGRASYDLLLIECILTGRLKFLSHINPPLARRRTGY